MTDWEPTKEWIDNEIAWLGGLFEYAIHERIKRLSDRAQYATRNYIEVSLDLCFAELARRSNAR